LEDDRRAVVTFDEMMRRSNQLTRWLSSQGVARGDVVLLMLGNQVELWQSMLAIMKLGAIILPATVALGPKELSERIGRADVRHVIANASDTHKFEDVASGVTRISVGAAKGWADLCDHR
jgi:acetyl-CoA synthetase